MNSLFDCRNDDDLITQDEMDEQYAADYIAHKERVAAAPRRTRGMGGGGAGGPEANASNDPLLAPAAVQGRWAELGLSGDPRYRQFAENAEWASLGCYCGPARALQLLDLRKKAYPFDFMRSDVHGVTHLVKNGFSDFFTQSGPPRPGVVPHEQCFSTTWGGSFWHHDITKDDVKSGFKRRIDRLYGKDPSIPPNKPRVFVHVVNGSQGVPLVHELHRALQRALPQSKVYMLTLIDKQAMEEVDRLHYSTHPTVLFYKVPGHIWTVGNFQGLATLADAYTHGIAHAIKVWTGSERAMEQQNLRAMADSVAPFYATNPAYSLYNVLEGEPELNQYLETSRPEVMHAYEDEDSELRKQHEARSRTEPSDEGTCAPACSIL
mmetsp:Transcript_38159/g.89501  ORF Transcript_38159/g.89501 Transcript_38159/m.89501 type:complete len:378 (+) Transcript_38159:90-1223(+)|eukprot:CAMPEP_0178400292 /NCGR_PEP_ID=MMETSP0689_2-20121128/15715_1 /TAXON_ID=160604 /ORGANISM="Amphidinium massartii, Strain CS-259" /LENGTH=377 /DNA_ID=CAMNT_0020021085 /DNA_START=77 /DNA_END=1210 /DNA_ORIENTATION=-